MVGKRNRAWSITAAQYLLVLSYSSIDNMEHGLIRIKCKFTVQCGWMKIHGGSQGSNFHCTMDIMGVASPEVPQSGKRLPEHS